MVSERFTETGSRISIWLTDTTVSECYEAGQFLAAWTRDRPGLPILDDSRALYWRNEIVGALFEHSNGVVLDTRTDAGGGAGGIDGVLIAKADPANPAAAILVACEGNEDARIRLLAAGRQWAQSRGRQLGRWVAQAPVFMQV